MDVNFRPLRIRPWQIGLSLIAFVLCLALAGCAAQPRIVPTPCPQFPARPVLLLPPVGHFHQQAIQALTQSPQ